MNDRDDDNIVSLDQRRRADQARQKAELAAEAARRRANGGSRPANLSFGQPGATRPPGGGLAGAGRLLGGLAAVAVWGGLLAMVVIAVVAAAMGVG